MIGEGAGSDGKALLALGLLALSQGAAAAGLDADKIESLLREKGAAAQGEFKVAVPQQELRVRLDGFVLTPPMGLTSWVVFAPHGDRAMAMGDFVLLEDELGPAQRIAVQSGLSVTAIHNHFLRETPKLMYMHIAGMGDQEKIADAVRRILDKVREMRAEKKMQNAPSKVESSLDEKEIEAVIGHAGKTADGVTKIVIGRPDVEVRDAGSPVGSFMGVNTWMAFQGTKEKAAVSGDFAMLAVEVEGVIAALVKNGIEVTAVHNHMIAEDPRVFFLHFWGVGPQAALAKGLKEALDQTGRARPGPR